MEPKAVAAVVLVAACLPPTSGAQADRLRALARNHRGIVFTQLPTRTPLVGLGARLVLLSPDGATRVLSSGFHSAADPEVSFDGQRVLFAGKKTASDNWNIYEMEAAGTGLRQITRGLGDCRSPAYQSSFYVLDGQPWYQLTFVSAASGELNESSDAAATSLYSVKLDGSAVRRLTFNPSSSLDPHMLPDGRVLFAAWDRPQRMALFGVHLDGADFALFSAEEGRSFKRMPCVTTGRLVVFVEADKLPWDDGGCLSSVSLRRNLHSYRRITAEKDGLFHSPSPLPDGAILVSRRPSGASGTYGIYRLEPASGRFELLFDDPDHHDVQAKLIHPRPEPDGHSSVVDEKDPTGKLYCLNVYTSDVAMPAGAARRLRVLEGLPRKQVNDPLRTRFLGEIDLDDDGSFNIQVPANIPIRLQVLDSSGMALRSSSWIWVKNHENRGCIGCHEDRELTPENVLAKALMHPSFQLTLPPEKRRSVDYRRDVLPILSQKCATQACHDPGSLASYIQPGSARTSPIIRRLSPHAGSRPLTEDEKRAIIEWIDTGAHK